MKADEMDKAVKNLDQRTSRIEQILPTLPTREDLDAAIAPLATKAELAAAIAPLATKAELAAVVAPLATKAELAAAIAPLATKAELREEGEQTRRHFDVVAERIESRVALIAEATAANMAGLEQERTERQANDARLDARVTRLEASPRRRR